MSNPFNFNDPTPPEKFLGRWDTVSEIVQDLGSAQCNSHAIVAGRRCGKTSLLHALQSKLRERLGQTVMGEWHLLPVFLDVLSLKHDSPYSVYRGLVRELRLLATKNEYTFVQDPIFPLELDSDLINKYYGENAPSSGLDEFKTVFAHAASQAKGKYGPVRFVFLLDEVDEISDKDWTNELFGNLRSLTTDPRTSLHFRFVMAGSQRFLNAQHRPGSPLLNMFEPHCLEPFAKETTQQLIAQGGRYSTLVAEAILTLSGGHPYITQFLMHYLWYKQETATLEDVQAIAHKLCSQHANILHGWCEAMGHSGRHVFRVMSGSRDWLSHQIIRGAIMDPSVEIDEGLYALLYHNLILQNGESVPPQYKCGSELFRQWFLENRRPNLFPFKPATEDTVKPLTDSFQVAQETYTDFHLRIDSNGERRVVSAEGERSASGSLSVPSSLSLTMNLIEKKQTSEDLLRDFGKILYEFLFPGPIHTHFNQTEAVARERKQRVRIRLTVDPSELSQIPWEFTYREEGGYYLSMHPSTVFSRYLDLPVPTSRVRRREGPLDLLLIVANPNDQTPLDPEEWDRIVITALDEPIKAGAIAIRRVKEATRRNISDSLLKRKPDIVQFVGHGIYENGKGHLALVDGSTGGTWLVDDARFADIFLGTDDHLGLVSLATCESAQSDSLRSFLGIAPQIVQRGVPAVVAMQYKVLVDTARIFLEGFYKAVAARKPVDWAVQWARREVSLEEGVGNREFATPVLFMRAKDGNVF